MDYPTALSRIADTDLITLKRDLGDGNFIPMEVTAAELKAYCGSGGENGTYNMALNGAEPPSDGTVPSLNVFDTVKKYKWYNSGTLASPTWNNV